MIEEKFLEALVAGFTKEIISESKGLFKDIYDDVADEVDQFIGRDLKNYLKKQQDKYSYIKTLLRGNSPVYLYDVYYPLNLEASNKVLNTDSISVLTSKNKYITIIGDAGSGKSTLSKHLFINSIKEKYKIPILIELRYLNDSKVSLEDFIRETIAMNKISVNSRILNGLLEKGKFFFFLDGFDELGQSSKKSVVRDINCFVDKFPDNNFILTSRPYSNIEHLPLFENYKMKDLSLKDGEIKGFVYKQLEHEAEMADKIIKSIESAKGKYIHSFLKNPLLLSLYILTFQSYASIPDKKYIFYRRVINALFSEHDSKTKLGFVREKHSGLNQEQFESILKAFSFISYFENKFSFDVDYVLDKLRIIKKRRVELKFDNDKFITDLKSAIALWIDDEGELSFAHRSLQEYFAALFIKELSADENKRVYIKIQNMFAESRVVVRETENLLSLLEEMDEFNYNNNYYLPGLKELLSFLDVSSESRIACSYVNFFTKGIGFRDLSDVRTNEPKALPVVKDSIYKTVQIHLPYTRRLFDYLEKVYQENISTIELRYSKPSEPKQEVVERRGGRYDYVWDFDNGAPEEIINIVLSPELTKISITYLKFLRSEIERVTKFLEDSLNNQKDIVDLI